MIKFAPLAALATVATLALVPTAVFAETTQVAAEATAQGGATAAIVAGKMLYSSQGSRIGAIYRVNGGNPQIILNGRLVTIPASSVSEVGGKLTTSLSKKEIASSH